MGVEEKSMDNNFLSDDDEEFSRKWSFQSSYNQDPGSVCSSNNTLDYSIEQNDTSFDELLHKINDESGSNKCGGTKSNIFLFDNNNISSSTAVGTNIGYSTNNDSTSRIIHNATSPPPPSHRPEYGKMNSHGSGLLAVPLVTPPGLTKATDCRAQKNQQPPPTTTTTKSTPAATDNQNIDKVDDDGMFVGRNNGGGGCGVCLGLSETVDTTLSSMTDLFMDYIGGNNTIDNACAKKWENVPGVVTGFQYETAAQKQARLRAEKQYAWKCCFEDE